MAMHRKHNMFYPGDIVDLIPELPRESPKTEKRRKQVRGQGPYKLLIIRKVEADNYLVAVCKKRRRNTQLCIKTNIGCLYVILSNFFLIDKKAISLCRGEYLDGNKQARIRIIIKARNAFMQSGMEDFFVDLLQPANNNTGREAIQIDDEQIQQSLGQKQPVETNEIRQSLIIDDDLLLQLPILDTNATKCPYCKREFSGMSPIKYRMGEKATRYTTARNCITCKLVILDANQLEQLRGKNGSDKIHTLTPNQFKTPMELMEAAKTAPSIQNYGSKSKDLPFEAAIKMPVNLSEYGKQIIIFAQKCHCANCFKKYNRHTIISRTAKVFTTSGNLVDVNVMFCVGCGRYYMAYESFKQYKKIYGRLLFECVLSSEFQNSQPAFLNFAPDSLLSRWGYNVKIDTPKEHRQAILQFLLETQRISKFEAIEMIKGFITLKEKQPRFYDACERWREDILFINNYKIKGQDTVYGLIFEQGGKISR